MRDLILGSNGNLARAFSSVVPQSEFVSRQEYLQWTSPGQIKKYLGDEPLRIYITVGLVGNDCDEQIQRHLNLDLPIMIAKALEGTPSKMFTFGTVMEQYPDIVRENRYVRLKSILVSTLNEDFSNLNYTHFQLHTLYGGHHLNPSMFLSKMIFAIKNRQNFRMSAGHQLRQYHHVHDISRLIYCEREGLKSRIQLIGNNDYISLREIATLVFERFDDTKNLKFDANIEIGGEVFSPRDFSSARFASSYFRDQRKGIIDFVAKWI